MSASPRILVATDKVDDAKLIRRLLASEFDNVGASSDPDKAVEDFEQDPPAVLLLAFDTLEKSELYYLGLYRRGPAIQATPHRTVILCNKDSVHQVYTLCRKQYFDDYVLFWPVGHDAPRLLMAVHHALRHHATAMNGQPSSNEIAAKVRRLGSLDAVLEGHATKGKQVADGVHRSLDQAGAEIGRALAGITDWLAGREGEALLAAGDRLALGQAIERLQAELIERHLDAVAASVQPVQQWAGGLHEDLIPLVANLRSLKAIAARVPRIVLIVDDDPFQHTLLDGMLHDCGYETVHAASAAEAMAQAGRRPPDIVLMDVELPDVDGIAATRQIKTSQRYAATPVLMIAGHGEKDVVVRSVQAGAGGFLVKPFAKEALLAKLAAGLGKADAAAG